MAKQPSATQGLRRSPAQQDRSCTSAWLAAGQPREAAHLCAQTSKTALETCSAESSFLTFDSTPGRRRQPVRAPAHPHPVRSLKTLGVFSLTYVQVQMASRTTERKAWKSKSADIDHAALCAKQHSMRSISARRRPSAGAPSHGL